VNIVKKNCKGRIILGIDTSTSNCSVGLIKNMEITGEESTIDKNSASENLLFLIDNLMKNSAIKFDDINAIAVSIGPGSYTGLRIGLSTAKGLAFPKKIPVIPVPTLTVLENIARSEWKNEDILLFITSHKNNIYYTISYSKNRELNLTPLVEFSSFREAINKNPGIEIIIGNQKFLNEGFKNIQVRYPNGVNVAKIARDHFDRLLPLSKPDLEPEYFTDLEIREWKHLKN
jgi:tRNA threonylcarbamoyl adenosine modification protein YeaZ